MLDDVIMTSSIFCSEKLDFPINQTFTSYLLHMHGESKSLTNKL